MIVEEYEKKFFDLSRFVAFVVSDERKRCRLFEECL